MELAYPPGSPPPRAGPLARFLPPLEGGVTQGVLAEFGQPGDLVLDPFGASPQLVLEAARAGRAVLVAANNPVTRFVLTHTLVPFSLSQLQSALAHLGSLRKDGNRLESFLLNLYLTQCSDCGQAVTADYFVWDRETGALTLKGYACPHCNHVAEEPVTRFDREQADRYSGSGLQYALALEQVAPAGDPERSHAEAALEVYPGRARYALVTLVTKLDQLQLEPDLKEAAHALLLSAFDAINALWGHPEGRDRPRRLVASPRYREDNVWRALERAVDAWALEDPGVELGDQEGTQRPAEGAVTLFPGPVRDWLDQIAAWKPDGVLTVLPRPNQAYWTLSALWSAWLWGRRTAAPIRVALRRRRYDWSWHATALRSTLAGLAGVMETLTPALTLIPEAEPGFVEAALTGLQGAGFDLTGRAIRFDTREALLTWKKDGLSTIAQPARGLTRSMTAAAAGLLTDRGEPAPYAVLHAAVWFDLALREGLTGYWQAEAGQLLTVLGRELEAALEDRQTLVRLDENIELESGIYALADPSGSGSPLSDRVEASVLDLLRTVPNLTTIEIEARVNADYPGLQTPDRRLVRACLSSYAELDEGSAVWRLREEDAAAARRQDIKAIRGLLAELGEDLGFSVRAADTIEWLENGAAAFAFCVQETTALGSALSGDADPPITFVLPGGRAGLIAYKSLRDPRVAAWLQRGVRVVKFRHIRRLRDDSTLTRPRLHERLAMDPPDHQDPQLPLL